MQSEEQQEVSFKAETTGMTFSDTSIDKLILSGASIEELKGSPSGQHKLNGLGTEVEKMVPDSPPSTDTDEEKAQEPNESIQSWLQRITLMQNEIQKKLHVNQASEQHSKPANTPPNASRIVKYQDLPYMGEMTLDNSKPRRGRKPKKADICHLIYKNYGTIFPGTPNAKSIINKDPVKKIEPKLPETVTDNFNRSDVQNRIISSLLEKRLTQESKRQKEVLATKKKALHQNEPLNLCIRDMDQLNIRLLDKPDIIEVKSEPQSDDDVEFVHETPSPASIKDFKFPDPSHPPVLSPDSIKLPENGPVYWPNASIFIHPMALQQQLLYYQKMAANNNNSNNNNNNNQTPPQEAQHFRKIVPKTKPRKSETSEDEEKPETKTKRNATSTDKTPAKRKRSAIFIPPIPTENPNNPATEVSICKFKFTGGAKPSLQEKKMLSVDSGGNFCYYSGTGDKSMRGYEFFPRETLQQRINNAQCSSTGAFLQASGEKIYPTSPTEFAGKEFMMNPEIQQPTPSISSETTPRTKKRKSRKSLQREKLEQTFKEKGFLIQTQQLESAEGATYCKFRQLRKFTRYLFRSWKDYLPGNVSEGQEGAERPEGEEPLSLEPELESNLSSPGIEGDSNPP
ncbi:PREDICTED: uncharacterized protein DDB_G0284459 isoform X2 [Nicrophorus vespilloides]|nr:PREDICTED: uncharacterized protein DDB_G0284459 isoform X2 [Nicrophorus vespilloides]